MNTKPTKKFTQEQKRTLEVEREKLEANIEKLKKEDPFSDPDHASDNAAVDTDVREQIGHDTIEAEIKALRRKISDIDHALVKIKDGEYGYCEKCHGFIPKARLKLVPEARFCVSCLQK